MIFKCLLTSLLTMILVACNPTQQTQDGNANTSVTPSNSKLKKMIEFKKGGCHGRCPIYNLRLYPDGRATYDGLRFSDRLGMHTKMLSKTQVQAIFKEIDGIGFWSFPEKYDSRIPDLASSTLVYTLGDKAKSVFWREQADEKLKALGRRIETIADEESGWAMSEKQEMSKHFIPNELIANIHPDTKPAALCKDYADYNLQTKEQIHPNGNYWVLSFDDTKIVPYEMLNKLNRDERVLMIEFNKKTALRN